MNPILKSLIIDALDADLHDAIGNARYAPGSAGQEIPDADVLTALELQKVRELKQVAWCLTDL